MEKVATPSGNDLTAAGRTVILTILISMLLGLNMHVHIRITAWGVVILLLLRAYGRDRD